MGILEFQLSVKGFGHLTVWVGILVFQLSVKGFGH